MGSHKQHSLAKEVAIFRVKIRSNKYLSSPANHVENVFSLSGDELDSGLKTSQQARELRANYYDKYMHMESHRSLRRCSVPFDAVPVFVTKAEQEEYHKVENRTIPEIKSLIENTISELNDDIRAEYDDIWKTELQKGGAGRTKNVYLHFYREIKDIVDTQLLPTDVQSDDEDEDI